MFYICVSKEVNYNQLKNNNMTTYSHKEVIGKGCEIKLNGQFFYCYNQTSLLHFVKCNKKGERLSLKNKNNLINLSVGQVERFIELGSIFVTVGVNPNKV